MKKVVIIFLVCFSIQLKWMTTVVAQSNDASKGFLMPAVVIDGDTLYVDYLETIYFNEPIGTDRKAYLDRLRYNIFKVFPYAILASNVLKKMDHDLGTNPSKRDRRKYINTLDIELNSKFKDELKNLSETQGKILVKLVNRQTGRKVYDIIKELKGGVNARFYQTAFSFIDNDLKTQYDPFGVDKDIEMIVKEIEAGNYFKHQPINSRIK